MKREIKLWETICDFCKKREHHSSALYKLPEGWTTTEVYNCGSTGYTDYKDTCPKCTVEFKSRN